MNWAIFFGMVSGGVAVVLPHRARRRRHSPPPKSKQEAINRSHMRALAHFLVLVALYATISTAYLVGTGGRFADWNPLRLIAVIGLPMLSFHSIRAAVRIYRSPRGHPPAES
jgi:hypothetical protein